MKIQQDFKGFTPLVDTLVEELGLVPAAVYGAVWRFCQMRNHVCSASLQKIAARAGVHLNTAQRHVKALVAAGYLIDTTPDLHNRPHTYRDAGRVKMGGVIEATVSEGDSTTPEKCSTTPEKCSGYTREVEHATPERCEKILLKETSEETLKKQQQEAEKTVVTDSLTSLAEKEGFTTLLRELAVAGFVSNNKTLAEIRQHYQEDSGRVHRIWRDVLRARNIDNKPGLFMTLLRSDTQGEGPGSNVMRVGGGDPYTDWTRAEAGGRVPPPQRTITTPRTLAPNPITGEPSREVDAIR